MTLEDEARTHLNSIHYDPVRHGPVERAAHYAWSSLVVHAPPVGVAKVARALYRTVLCVSR